jgi:hypothetical protein
MGHFGTGQPFMTLPIREGYDLMRDLNINVLSQDELLGLPDYGYCGSQGSKTWRPP